MRLRRVLETRPTEPLAWVWRGFWFWPCQVLAVIAHGLLLLLGVSVEGLRSPAGKLAMLARALAGKSRSLVGQVCSGPA